MNTLAHNQRIWKNYDWKEGGEEWSAGWGNSSAQWQFCVRPRIARFIPTNTILEIATGYGRWTRFLVDECYSFIGIDLVEQCTKYCAAQYQGERRRYISNDGLTLTGIGENEVSFVFSFDSFVHVDWLTLKSYLSEIVRVLLPGGHAFIHHSNASDIPDFAKMAGQKTGWRAPDVSARMVREELSRLGASVISQELIDWGASSPNLIDCFTVLSTGAVHNETVIVRNLDFMSNMRTISRVAPIYSQRPIKK